jgi:putative DNA primase/helicase
MTLPPPPLPTTAHRAASAGILAAAMPGLPDHWPAPSNPMGVARRLNEERTIPEGRTLLHWGGSWWTYTGTGWAMIDESTLTAWIYTRLEDAKWLAPVKPTARNPAPEPDERPWAPNRAKVGDTLAAWAAVAHLPADVEAPTWLAGPELAPAGRLIAVANGLLDLADRKVHPHTPRFLNVTAVPFRYDPAAPPAPPARWLAFLNQLWPDDVDAVSLLQEWFGYVVSGRTDLHKIMLLVGPPRSGKGTIGRVLAELMGRGNCASPTLASLATPFGLQGLLGRSLATIGDARLGTKVDSSQVVERLLSISGEDPIDVHRKFREAWHGRLPTRFLILSNELPRFGDASGAIARRFSTLTMRESFLGREDVTLGPALHAELPGILGWALDGLDRLAARNAFTSPASSAEAIAELHDLTSPVGAFVRDCCEVGSGEVSAEALFAAWRGWADLNGHAHSSSQTLGRNLRAALPALQVRQPREGGRRVRYYVGLHLAPRAVPAPMYPGQGAVTGGLSVPTPSAYMGGGVS